MNTCICKSVGSRVGLYIMVFILLSNSCDIKDQIENVNKELAEIKILIQKEGLNNYE